VLGLQRVRNYRKGVFVRFTTPRRADIRAAIDSRSAASMSAACRTASSLTASRISGFGTRIGIWDLGFGIWDLGFGIWDLGFGICLMRQRVDQHVRRDLVGGH
jgi:hypothetical protein